MTQHCLTECPFFEEVRLPALASGQVAWLSVGEGDLQRFAEFVVAKQDAGELPVYEGRLEENEIQADGDHVLIG